MIWQFCVSPKMRHMTSDRDIEISQLESQIEATRPEMELACDAFIEAAAARLSEFWPDYVKSCIAFANEGISKLDADQLSRLKAEVAEIQGSSQKVARKYFLDDWPSRWPHLAATDQLVEAAGSNRRSFGWVGEIKGPGADHGFLPEALKQTTEEAAGAVAKPFADASLPVRGSRWAEPKAELEWNNDMVESLRRYAKWASQAFEKAAELKRARERRSQDDALDRWNQA